MQFFDHEQLMSLVVFMFSSCWSSTVSYTDGFRWVCSAQLHINLTDTNQLNYTSMGNLSLWSVYLLIL